MPRGVSVHILSEIDKEERTATCAKCGLVPIRLRGTPDRASGGQWRCNKSDPHRGRTLEQRRARLKKLRSPYRDLVRSACERCGFIPENLVQLDVHHRDGNHRNNNPENLQTLCANCHRLCLL